MPYALTLGTPQDKSLGLMKLLYTDRLNGRKHKIKYEKGCLAFDQS